MGHAATDDWDFREDAGEWLWCVTRANGTRHRSSQRFETLHECVEDARRHGYLARPERRNSRQLARGCY